MKNRSFLTLLVTVIIALFFISSIPVIAKTSTPSSTKKDKQTTSKKKTKSKSSTKKAKTRVKAKTGKVNINAADAKTLTELTGIGPKTAKNIISYRKKNGKFKTANDLLQVKGIGEKTLKKMKSQLRF